MKTDVVTLEQGRARIAKRKEADERHKVLSLHKRIWEAVLAELGAEPDAAAVGFHIVVMYPPNHWWASGWSATLKKLFYRDRHKKKRYIHRADLYEELAKHYADAASQYRALGRKKGK